MDKPILFSTPMVKAILEGRKTQTRRVKGLDKINKSQYEYELSMWEGEPTKTENGAFQFIMTPLLRVKENLIAIRPPYSVGDRLWVRERHWVSPQNGVYYYADWENKDFAWKPSIHMFKLHARIWLEVTEVRVQRLQEISEEDCIQEGITEQTRLPGYDPMYAMTYMILWDKLNSKRGYSWESNPWVWAISFKRLEAH